MSINIRRVDTQRELEQVFALDQLIFGLADGAMHDKGEMDGAYWWLCWQDNTPVGYCGLQIKYGLAFHERSGLLPLARGKGLQRRFLSVRERFAKKEGCSVVATYVSRFNSPSINNLFRAGYKSYEPQWPWAGEDFQAVYVYKDLK
jgi:GNAT superfamily N-acetyltransferase